MRRMLMFDYFRGMDSTGLAAIRQNKATVIAKVPSHPLDLFDMNKFKSALSGSSSVAFIGHNRAATRGVINHFNTHPFEFDHITGAHNGTLDSLSQKRLEDAMGERFPVDSQAMIAGLAKLGVEETVSLCEEGKTGSDGAWALVWYDASDDTINFLRNKHRPMWYAFNEELTHLFWASEHEIINAAVKTSGAHKFFKDDKGFSFWQMEADVHYKYEISAVKKGGKVRPKAKAKEVKGREPFQASYTSGAVVPFVPRPQNLTNTNNTLGYMQGRGIANKSSVLHVTSEYPFFDVVSEERFTEICKGRCTWCNDPVTFWDKGMMVYERHDAVLCKNCCSHGPDGINKVHIPPTLQQKIEHLF
jgi:hypothetical protein